MRKNSVKFFSVILSILMIFSSVCILSYADDSDESISINVISFNVDGLPVPSSLSSTGREPAKATKLIAEEINKTDCNILCVQEDFNFHSELSSGLDMENETVTSGPAVIGDGLNTFSDYPIYNVGRVAWDTASGVFTDGSDELTPKGIMYCTVEIAEGVYIDVYTLHADACEDDESMLAKSAQFDQLTKLIEEHSGSDRAVLLTGDFNTNYSVFREGYAAGRYNIDLCEKLKECFLDRGFKDAWVEANNEGNYDFTYDEMYKRYGTQYPRNWDTLDHIYYRDGAGVSFELIDSYYEGFDCEDISWDGHLSDHAAVYASFNCIVDRSQVKAPDSLKKENKFVTGLNYFFKGIGTFFRVLWIAVSSIPALIRDGVDWMK